ASLFFHSARTEFRQSSRARRREEGLRFLAVDGRGWTSARCHPVSLRTGRHELRESSRDAQISPRTSRPRGREVPESDAAFRGKSVAGGRGWVFWEWRRGAHEFSFPAHAAHVHGAPDGGPVSNYRHHGADAGDPGELSVGNVSAQPRRAYAGNGDRRGARLHVSSLRDRSARAYQSWHPPAAWPAACE